MANTKISALTANTNPNWNEEFVYAYNNANGKITLDTMKSFVWWAGITTLNADANIWELNEWTYVTTYDLYYKSWEKVPVMSSAWATKKQMLFVAKESTWEIGFFVYNIWHASTNYRWRASYWYSISSSVWECNRLWAWNAALDEFGAGIAAWTTNAIAPLGTDTITQLITNISSSTQSLSISSSELPYVWMTYTIYIESASSTYDVTLGTWVTNPFGFTLPTGSDKPCLITVLITSTTTGIITQCKISS